ncbi:thiamine phosphate synthase [Actinoplanes sp. NPDC051633]|uniref:thiamine phosphate synthase n=1 Tax=Actinoplanes sp. NPDC051633 TaxID=3155670 RepID=UPI003421823F
MVTPGGLVVLTDRRSAAGPLVEVVREAVRGGAAWVVLRERDLRYAQRRALADELRTVLPAGRLIIAGPDPLGGDAVHLAARDPLPTTPVRVVGRSCHSAEEVARLSSEDYLTLSPIYPTASKPGYGPPIGFSVAAQRPWLALGGIDSAARVRACRTAGAAGVAVMGAVMRADDPLRVAADLAAAWSQAKSGSPGGHPGPERPAGLPLSRLGGGRPLFGSAS